MISISFKSQPNLPQPALEKALVPEQLPKPATGLGSLRPLGRQIADGINTSSSVMRRRINSDAILLSNGHRMNQKPLVINLITPDKYDQGLNNHRNSQINGWTGPGVAVSLIHRNGKLAFNLNGREFRNSSLGHTVADEGFNPLHGFTLRLSSQFVKKTEFEEAVKLVVEQSSDASRSAVRKKIFINSHLTAGLFKDFSEFPSSRVTFADISKILINAGVAGKNTDIVFTGCILPEYNYQFLPQIKLLAANHGVTIHLVQTPQDTGRLHDMVAIGPDGILRRSEYNGQ